MHLVRHYCYIRKDERMPFPVTGKKPEVIILSEVETGKERDHRTLLLVESKKWIQMKFVTKEKHQGLGKES